MPIGSRRLPLQEKFRLAAGLVAALFIASFAAVAGALLSSQGRLERILTVEVPSLVEAANLERSVTALDLALSRLETAGGPEWAAVVSRRRAEARQARAAIAERYLPAESKITLARIDELRRRHETARASERAAAFKELESAFARFRAPLAGDVIGARQSSASADRAVVWAVVALAALAAAAAWRFGRFFYLQVVEPLEQLAEFASRVGRAKEGEALPEFPRLDVRSVDEIGLLASALDQMSKRLEAQVVQLKEFDQLKSKFVSMVSHEFRIPLTAVSEYGEMLSEGVAGPVTERQRQYLETIAKNARRLSVLTENLLNLAKIEAGRFGALRARVELPELFASIARTLEPLRSERGVALKIDDDGVPPASADPALLELALTNLVGNAILYNKPRGGVELTARWNGATIDVAVTDDGPGIAPEVLPRLFSGFYRASPGASKGTGLGLPITKEIVEAHGATLEVRSKLGEGTAFRFTLERWEEAA